MQSIERVHYFRNNNFIFILYRVEISFIENMSTKFNIISGATDSGSQLSIRLEIGKREVRMRHLRRSFEKLCRVQVIPTTDLLDFKRLKTQYSDSFH